MSNDGTSLEKLVSEIERKLLPEGYGVEVRKKIYNADGVQIAEFDIEIKGKVGSSELHWLIECRDRPSDGPAPVCWIEQLYGRRHRFKIDRVFAVSTTGFSPGAVEFAEQEHIFLRNVEDITNVADDFVVKELHWTDDDIKISQDIQIRRPDRRVLEQVDLDHIRIRPPGETTFWDTGDFIMAELESVNTFADGSGAIALVEQRVYRNTTGLEAMVGDVLTPITELAAPIEIIKHTFVGKLLLARSYSEGTRVIGQEGECEFQSRDGLHRCRVQVVNDQENGQMIFAVLPDGSPLSGTFEIR